MSGDKVYYESKVFLKSYADAIHCLKECAEQEVAISNYERQMTRLLFNKKNSVIEVANGVVRKGAKYADSREDKLNSFSETLFKNHFNFQDSNFMDIKNNITKSFNQILSSNKI